jgi:hypothetical protein
MMKWKRTAARPRGPFKAEETNAFGVFAKPKYDFGQRGKSSAAWAGVRSEIEAQRPSAVSANDHDDELRPMVSA